MDPHTPATQAFPQGDPVDVNPVQDSPTQNDPKQSDPKQNVVGKPARPHGPNAAPVVLGLVALALAALIILNETTNLRVDWSRLGPGAIVGIGALLVVLGAIGLVRRHDDG
ncbi:MAG TPA: hypothetical protein VN712_09580 [Dermatophilaceae bacterium]|jgi:hypothetical protein|nr:hypothetical protein [Dermatophilaceae bacterium]